MFIPKDMIVYGVSLEIEDPADTSRRWALPSPWWGHAPTSKVRLTTSLGAAKQQAAAVKRRNCGYRAVITRYRLVPADE